MISPVALPQQEDVPGSPSPGEPVFLAVGELRRPHGVRGEILMQMLTDFPERLKPGVMVYVGHEHQPLRLRSCRPHGRALLVTFEGYRDRESVGTLRNQLVQVRADDRPPLPAGEYYHHQLLGLRIVDETGTSLGRLVEIIETGANDVYVARPESGPEILLPATDEVILEINLARGQMRVHLLPGLQ